jgi:hypothetical protein
MKNTLQFMCCNCVEFACVLVETLKISISAKYCISVGEMISGFLLPKLGDICRVINKTGKV